MLLAISCIKEGDLTVVNNNPRQFSTLSFSPTVLKFAVYLESELEEIFKYCTENMVMTNIYRKENNSLDFYCSDKKTYSPFVTKSNISEIPNISLSIEFPVDSILSVLATAITEDAMIVSGNVEEQIQNVNYDKTTKTAIINGKMYASGTLQFRFKSMPEIYLTSNSGAIKVNDNDLFFNLDKCDCEPTIGKFIRFLSPSLVNIVKTIKSNVDDIMWGYKIGFSAICGGGEVYNEVRKRFPKIECDDLSKLYDYLDEDKVSGHNLEFIRDGLTKFILLRSIPAVHRTLDKDHVYQCILKEQLLISIYQKFIEESLQ